jgi:hypothetical protein
MNNFVRRNKVDAGMQKMADLMQLTAQELGAMTKAFYRKYGDDALPVVKEVMGEAGVIRGNYLRKGLSAQTIPVYCKEIMGLDDTIGMGLKVVEQSDRAFRFKSSNCPFGFNGMGAALCEAMMNADKMLLATCLGREAEVKILKSVAKGDQYCEVIESVK